MDRNQFIGLLLIGLLLFGYMFWQEKNMQKAAVNHLQDTTITDTAKNVPIDTQTVNQNTTPVTQTQATDTIDSLGQNALIAKYGKFGKQALGQEKFTILKNDKIIVKLTNKGARVYSVQVRGYKTHKGDSLILFNGDKNRFSITFSANRRPISTGDFYFIPQEKDTLLDASNREQKLVYRLYYTQDKWIDFIYSLKPHSYVMDFSVDFHNLKDIIPSNTTFLDLYWKTYMPPLEQGEKWELQQMNIFYKYYLSDVDYLNPRKDVVEKEVPTKLRWVSFKHQFFSSVLMAYDYFDEAKLKMQVNKDTSINAMKIMEARIDIPFNPLEQKKIKMAYFFGPNKYSLLKKIKLKPDDKLQLERMVPLGKGLIRWTNKFIIIPLFNILGRFFHNYGIIILLMTIIIKLVLFPLTYRTYMSSAKMRVLQPELKKVLEKIPEKDQMKRQQATMELYKKAGVSPLGGCLPTLFQLPILIAMFRFFPASIELRQQAFLWVKDLSTYDVLISWHGTIPLIGNHISLFALLMALSMVISTKLNATTTDESNPAAQSMKLMMWLMPVLMFVWFNNYSAALSYYYFLANLISIGQIYLVRAMIDEDKILRQLKENVKKNKNVKKSKWQQRLEQMQKQQELQQKKRKK